MIRLFLIPLIFIASCHQKKSPDLKKDVIEFDSNHGEEISKICKSLMDAGKDTSYVMVVSPDNENRRYREIDSTGRPGSYFVPSSSLSRPQYDFLDKKGVKTLNYNKKARLFFAELESFKSEDQTIWLYIDLENRRGKSKKPLFFEKDNRVYILDSD